MELFSAVPADFGSARTGLFGRGLVAFFMLASFRPMPRTRVALLHSRVTRFTQCLGGWGYRPEPPRLIGEALGLPTQCVAGQTRPRT
jgi:hypothetical protein